MEEASLVEAASGLVPAGDGWFRFRPGWSWAGHVAKSAFRQDHADLGRLLHPLLAADATVIDVGAHGGQVTRLLAERLSVNPDQKDELFYIRKSAQQLSDLVDDLLDIAKVEAGKIEIRPAAFELTGT